MNVESITGLGGTTWNTEETNVLASGLTESKKTNKQERTGTITLTDDLLDENPGYDMLVAYCEEEGDKERIVLIVEDNDADKTQTAWSVIVTDHQMGDFANTSLRKPVFTVLGNKLEEVPEDPSLGG